MSGGKNRKQKELEAQQRQYQTMFNQFAQKQAEGTERQKAIDAADLAVLQHQGDYSSLPGLGWSAEMGNLAAFNRRLNEQNMGALTLGGRDTSPTLQAGLREQAALRAGEQDSLAFERAVKDRMLQARSLESPALTAQRYGSILGPTGSMASDYAKFSTQLAGQPGFWSGFALKAADVGGQLGGAAILASDSTLKTDIEKLSTLNGVMWKWLGTDQVSAGVLAQEVEKVYPELVEEIDGVKQVHYTALTGLLVETLRELKEQ